MRFVFSVIVSGGVQLTESSESSRFFAVGMDAGVASLAAINIIQYIRAAVLMMPMKKSHGEFLVCENARAISAFTMNCVRPIQSKLPTV